MAYPRTIVFALATFALAGCCASGSGCYVAAPGVPTAWDGDGPGAEQDAAPHKKPMKRARSTAATAGPQARAVADANGEAVPPSDTFAAKEAADREADARLTKRLMICRGCLPPAADEPTGSVATR